MPSTFQILLQFWDPHSHLEVMLNFFRECTVQPKLWLCRKYDMEFSPDSNTVYTSGDTRICSQSHPPSLINEHKHPFGLNNPKFHFLLNSVLQLIFSIFWNNSYTSPFNSSTEGTLLKCLFQTANNARNSKDVDALKFQLVRHDTFYNGKIQQDSTECLLMLINIIHKGSLPDSS